MAISITEAQKIGDKKLRFGREGGPSLRGTLKEIVAEATAKQKAVTSAEVVPEAIKRLGLELKDDKSKKEFMKKVNTAMEDLKYAGNVARSVSDDGTKHYYAVEKKTEEDADESDEDEADEDKE